MKCKCGSDVPLHLLEVQQWTGGEGRLEHVCQCDRKYIAVDGTFTLVGVETNPVMELHRYSGRALSFTEWLEAEIERLRLEHLERCKEVDALKAKKRHKAVAQAQLVAADIEGHRLGLFRALNHYKEIFR